MKINALLVSILFSFLLFFGCEKLTDPETSTGKVQFSMSQSNRNALSKSQSLQPHAILLTIEDSQGKVIESNKVLNLFALGTGYISDNLSLVVGKYNITQFAVLGTVNNLDADNKIIYATPVEGSPLAQYVTDPLPIAFEVSKDNVSTIIPQVITVQDSDSPQDFGLANFGFEIVDTTQTPTSLKKLSEVIYSDYISWKNDYQQTRKVKYIYSGNNLSKKEEYYYLPDYDVFYLSSTEVYTYDANNRVSVIDFYVPKIPVPFWHYTYDYSENQITEKKYSWTYSEYNNTTWKDLLYTTVTNKNGSDLTINTTYHIGYEEHYSITAKLDANGNLVSATTYGNNNVKDSDITLSNYSAAVNPLKEPYKYGLTQYWMDFNNNVMGQITYKNDYGSASIDYQYQTQVYGKTVYPTAIFSSYSYDKTVTKNKMEFIYQ